MKIEKVSNLAVKVFVPYTLSILVETKEDEITLRNAASRLSASVHSSINNIAKQLLIAMTLV